MTPIYTQSEEKARGKGQVPGFSCQGQAENQKLETRNKKTGSGELVEGDFAGWVTVRLEQRLNSADGFRGEQHVTADGAPGAHGILVHGGPLPRAGLRDSKSRTRPLFSSSGARLLGAGGRSLSAPGNVTI